MPTNERLRARLVRQGWRPSDLAERLQVDPKTVERWISTGRVPRETSQWEVAKLLGCDPLSLWPEAGETARAKAVSREELVAFHPNRGLVPTSMWTTMMRDATEHIDVKVYAGLFWFDGHPELCHILCERADAGVSVRLAFGDPDSPAVALRGREEGIDMAARTRLTLGLIEPVVGYPGIEVRLHATTLYASLYRADDVMLVNTHAYGSPASYSPVLQLQRLPGGQVFDHYAHSFEAIWPTARPYEIDRRAEAG